MADLWAQMKGILFCCAFLAFTLTGNFFCCRCCSDTLQTLHTPFLVFWYGQKNPPGLQVQIGNTESFSPGNKWTTLSWGLLYKSVIFELLIVYLRSQSNKSPFNTYSFCRFYSSREPLQTCCNNHVIIFFILYFTCLDTIFL